MHDNDNIIEVDESSFADEVLQRSWHVPVVVDFWAPWCGPCRMLGPALEGLASQPENGFVLAKVNVDLNPNLSIRYGVRGIPAVKAFYQGEIVSEFVGHRPLPFLRNFVAQLVPAEEDALLNEGNSLLVTHHWSEAEEAFRNVLDVHPGDEDAMLGLAKALLGQGTGLEAAALLQRVHDGVKLVEAEQLEPLAAYLSEFADRESGVRAEADPVAVQFAQSAKLIQRGNWEAGMDGLLEVVRADKRFRDGAPRKIMLAIFLLFGDDDDRTQQYRRELAFLLF